MKSTIKLALVVFLFSSVTLADEGDMGNGTKSCTGSNCLATIPPPPPEDTKTTDSTNPVLTTVQEYLDAMFKYFGS